MNLTILEDCTTDHGLVSFSAVFVSLRSIIMAELLGIEKLTSSFGLVTMCQGLSAFIGAPIAGTY